MSESPLCAIVFQKVREQIERTEHLIDRIPPNALEWRPGPRASFSVGELLGHLLECLAGMCAALHKANPEPLAHFLDLRTQPVNRSTDPAETRRRIARYARHIDEGFAALRDDQLATRLPTVFVPEGEAVLTLLLGNLEHLINHKHQLFDYLKALDVPVATPDLYVFRGQPQPGATSS
jgi:hypothetical protein